ncbi:hypothetical protein GPNCGGLF_LOCUS2237 [Methylorubrum aminovorans]|jgi:hypothetical protein
MGRAIFGAVALPLSRLVALGTLPPFKSGLPDLGNPIADLGQARDLLGGGLMILQ